MHIAFKHHTIYISTVSRNWWQSEIWDGQQQLVGCTCDRNQDNTLLRAMHLVEFLFESPISQKE